MATSRLPRGPFPMDALTIIGEVDIHDIPPSTRALPGKTRRWEELGGRIRAAAPGKAVLVTLAPGTDAETVRQGVTAELKRFSLSSRIRSVTQADGSISLWMLAVPRGST